MLTEVSQLRGIGGGIQIPAFLTLNPISHTLLLSTAFLLPFVILAAGATCYLKGKQGDALLFPQPVLFNSFYIPTLQFSYRLTWIHLVAHLFPQS